jgi:hypothetical protein
MPDFVLQFAIEDVPAYAGRYVYAEDDEALAIGEAARRRGHYTRHEFVKICRWKSVRSSSYVARNSADAVVEATRTALADATVERERMRVLRSLHGVAFPTASVLLHVAYPERYPILDQRALQALGMPQAPAYSFRFWTAYVDTYVDLLRRTGVDGRTLDRALWQWSKEHGSPLR